MTDVNSPAKRTMPASPGQLAPLAPTKLERDIIAASELGPVVQEAFLGRLKTMTLSFLTTLVLRDVRAQVRWAVPPKDDPHRKDYELARQHVINDFYLLWPQERLEQARKDVVIECEPMRKLLKP